MGVRTERDAMGGIEVPDERLWGAQTQRSLERFRISDESMPRELVRALVAVKRACALVNGEFGMLRPEVAKAITRAADEVFEGRHETEFPLSLWQTGSGTQTNMNVNEVLANRAGELLGHPRGSKRVHPNDHVNLGQSSNDVIPTALHVAAATVLDRRVLPGLILLRRSLETLALGFADVVKVGRTHLQDAVPVTLGQELSGFASQLKKDEERIRLSLPALLELAIGGTAVGTGLAAREGFGERVAKELAHETGLPFIVAPNRFAAIAAHDAVVHSHASLRTLAVSLTKIANDVRLMASGPECGFGEITSPETEPGSSRMPGTVNPPQAEALLMGCAQVMGNDVTIGIAGASGQFELNVMKPLIAHLVLQSARLMADAMRSFEMHCVRGIEPRRDRLEKALARSHMLATALVPHVGYEAATRVVAHARANACSLRESAEALGVASGAQFDAWVDARRMAVNVAAHMVDSS